ncbi:MAG: hypothetical protein WC310_00795 [Patescibacteria group bacterium]|jgi:hypothetical protein
MVVTNIQDEILVKDSGGNFSVLVDQSNVGYDAVGGSAITPVLTEDNFDFSALIDKIKGQFNLGWKDEVLDRRLYNIIIAMVREVRNDIQTKDVMVKSVEVGGLGLEPIIADQVIAEVKKTARHPIKVKEMGRKVLSMVTAKTPSHVFSRQELDHEIAPPPPTVVVPTKAEQIRPISPLAPKPPVQSVTYVEKNFLPKKSVPRIEEIKKEASISNTPKPTAEHHLSSKAKPFMDSKPPFKIDFGVKTKGRNFDGLASAPQARVVMPNRGEKITDIRVPQKKLVGPLEELQGFRVADFRRLDLDPQKAILKIKEKIDLLGRESFSKRIEGKNAWQQSEVNRLYLALGKASIEQGRSLADIIKERSLKQEPTLKPEEFIALVKLNQILED